jgi:type IV secretory pathway VirJ component
MKKYRCICICWILILFSSSLLAHAKLVIIEKPCSKNDSTPMVVLYTGDGGWKPYDEKLADSLNKMDIPVMGVNSLDYFCKRRTPQESAHDIAMVITAFQEKWQKKKVILIGYSFGAEVVPFIYNQFPTQLKSCIHALVLLSPGSNSDFKVHLTDRLGWLIHKWNYDVRKEIVSIKAIPVILFFGKEEKTMTLDSTLQSNLSVYYLSGGHNFRNAEAVVKKIISIHP